MKKKIILAGAILIAGLAAQNLNNTLAQEATGSAETGNGQGTCLAGLEENKVEFTDEMSEATFIAVPEGTISAVYIKASTDCFEFTQDGSNGTYTVFGLGTGTVTVSEDFTDETKTSDQKDISHFEYQMAEASVVDPTPTPEPTVEPTAEPTPEPTDEPEDNDDSNDENNDSNENNDDQQENNEVGSVEENSNPGQVLGISTENYADAGVAEDILFSILGASGIFMSSAGMMLKRNENTQ